jgi:mono/diheme cytochrome c family protein
MRGMRLIAGAVGSILLAAGAFAADAIELPPGPNRALVYGQCRTCHDLQYLKESAGIPRSAWNDIIDSMKQYGLSISADQRARILDYLAIYLGPNPPPANAAEAPVAKTASADGAAVYRDQCVACHQANGEGVDGQFPPLAHNPDLFLSRDYPARVVLFGLSGKIVVGGKTIDSAMPPLDVLGDAEIATVVAYVRKSWGNAGLRPASLAPIDATTVKALRQNRLSSEQIYAERHKLKAAAAK